MILDTNTYRALQDARPELVTLVEQADRLMLPLPVVAELKAGYTKGTRTASNLRELGEFLSVPGVGMLRPDGGTAEAYARLQALCWERGRALSNNDIWIAALAQCDGDLLVTYDKDFLVFEDVFGDKLLVLPV